MYVVTPDNTFLIPVFPVCSTVGGYAVFTLIESTPVSKTIPLDLDGNVLFFVAPTPSLENLPAQVIYLNDKGSQWSVEVFTSNNQLQRRFLLELYDA